VLANLGRDVDEDEEASAWGSEAEDDEVEAVVSLRHMRRAAAAVVFRDRASTVCIVKASGKKTRC
jgi:hypothetical protein